ncbi:MAG: DUF4296 domain-containing protein [Saprospiraceae bacterium]|nr:DUF4296 domain-containing protein [Saprospiraceae bacterium]MDW8229805.1 DUF4296 domain-containing protein [Saprospiraceae bacterium]
MKGGFFRRSGRNAGAKCRRGCGALLASASRGHWATFRRAGLCLLLALAVAACQSPEQTRLPEETLARVMADLHIAEAATTGLTGFRKDSLLYLYYEQIFALHGVKREDYEHDIRLLSRDENRMMRLVEAAEDLLKEASGEQ